MSRGGEEGRPGGQARTGRGGDTRGLRNCSQRQRRTRARRGTAKRYLRKGRRGSSTATATAGHRRRARLGHRHRHRYRHRLARSRASGARLPQMQKTSTRDDPSQTALGRVEVAVVGERRRELGGIVLLHLGHGNFTAPRTPGSWGEGSRADAACDGVNECSGRRSGWPACWQALSSQSRAGILIRPHYWYEYGLP